MKRMIFIYLIFLLNFSIYSETINIAMTAYDPIIIVENDKVSGIFIEILNESFKKVGLTPIYKEYPWKRGQELVENNKIDAVIPLFKTKEREKIFLFSNPVMKSKNKFFYIKGRNISEENKFNTLADFKKYKVGGVLGYWYLEDFKKAGINPELVISDQLNLQKLYAGRIDTFIGDEVFGWDLIIKNYPKEKNIFATLNKPEIMQNRYILFGKNNPNSKPLLEKFNKGLEMLKNSGEYNKIIKKYNFTN